MFTAYRRYFDFRGRSNFREYWPFIILFFVVYIFLFAIDMLLGIAAPELGIGVLSGLFLMASLIPLYSTMVRRLHDADHSGWWVLAALIPYVNFVAFIVIGVLPRTNGPNRFGPEQEGGQPYRPDSDLQRLEQLGRLRDQGILSEAEFESQKAVVLRGTSPET